MHLVEDRDLGQVVIDRLPNAVDEAADGGLRNPRNGLIEDRALDAVEEVELVAIRILDIAATGDLLLDLVLPLADFRAHFVIPLLNALGLMHEQADAGCDACSGAEVVRAVA